MTDHRRDLTEASEALRKWAVEADMDPFPGLQRWEGRDGACKACGLDERAHQWRCRDCGEVLPPGTCGCGACLMPGGLCTQGCSRGARLYCVKKEI